MTPEEDSRKQFLHTQINNRQTAIQRAMEINLRQCKIKMVKNVDYKKDYPNECKEFATHKTFVELNNRLKKDAEAVKKNNDKIRKRYEEVRLLGRRR